MKWWPWVSRERLDDKDREIARLTQALLDRESAHERTVDLLLERQEDLMEQITRMSRFGQGMTERPRHPKGPVPSDIELPDRLNAYVEGFGDPTIKMEQRRVIRRRLSRGETAGEIEADLLDSHGINDLVHAEYQGAPNGQA